MLDLVSHANVRKQFVRKKSFFGARWEHAFLLSSIHVRLARSVRKWFLKSCTWFVYIVSYRYFRFMTTVLPYLLNYSCFIFHGLAAFQFKTLIDIVAVDTGKGFRFRIYYLLFNHVAVISKTLLIYVSSTASCYSLTPIFKSASWSEKEIWDLFGIRAIANYEISRILTDYNFEYHPFREDFNVYYLVEIDFTEWDELLDVGRQFKKQWHELGL